MIEANGIKIGDHVRYISDIDPNRTCTGTVDRFYPGYVGRDENGERYEIPTSVSIRVDEPLPDWWAYDRDPDGRWYGLFAPCIDNVVSAGDGQQP